MKKFETPVIDIEKFDIADVITTSGCINDMSCPEDGWIPDDDETGMN